MLFKKIPGDPQLRFFVSKCKYCGKDYIKLQNKTGLCSDECRHKSNQDSKARYQQKRRLLIKHGELVEYDKELGTTFLSGHALVDNWNHEHQRILAEKGRVGIS